MYKREQLEVAIKKCLNERETLILKARLGLDSKPLTIEQTLKNFKINIDEYREIESKVINYLKDSL